jgi:hypothetical protein
MNGTLQIVNVLFTLCSRFVLFGVICSRFVHVLFSFGKFAKYSGSIGKEKGANPKADP